MSNDNDPVHWHHDLEYDAEGNPVAHGLFDSGPDAILVASSEVITGGLFGADTDPDAVLVICKFDGPNVAAVFDDNEDTFSTATILLPLDAARAVHRQLTDAIQGANAVRRNMNRRERRRRR